MTSRSTWWRSPASSCKPGDELQLIALLAEGLAADRRLQLGERGRNVLLLLLGAVGQRRSELACAVTGAGLQRGAELVGVLLERVDHLVAQGAGDRSVGRVCERGIGRFDAEALGPVGGELQAGEDQLLVEAVTGGAGDDQPPVGDRGEAVKARVGVADGDAM